jgi:hypothetical protein
MGTSLLNFHLEVGGLLFNTKKKKKKNNTHTHTHTQTQSNIVGELYTVFLPVIFVQTFKWCINWSP